MSAGIYWRPVNAGKKYVPTQAPSRFIAALEAAFGKSMPITISSGSFSKLQGMAAVFDKIGQNGENPYQMLIDGIRSHGTIEVVSEY